MHGCPETITRLSIPKKKNNCAHPSTVVDRFENFKLQPKRKKSNPTPETNLPVDFLVSFIPNIDV
jgi:hypothetical protein